MLDLANINESPEYEFYAQESEATSEITLRRRTAFQPVLEVVSRAQALFLDLLMQVETSGGFTPLTYQRYLSLQYYFTKDVQRDFIGVAAHHSFNSRRKLRDFLFNFAQEEEPHYAVAERDLRLLGLPLLPCPIDVQLWQSYFKPLIPSRPLFRLGATCVLENLGPGVSEVGKRLFASADFITPQNSRFFQIHFHEALPHGDQIIAALTSVSLSEKEIAELREGAVIGAISYLRMVRWVFGTDTINEGFREFLGF